MHRSVHSVAVGQIIIEETAIVIMKRGALPHGQLALTAVIVEQPSTTVQSNVLIVMNTQRRVVLQ